MQKLNQYVQEKKAKIKRVRQLEHYLDSGIYEFDNEFRVLFNKSESKSPILDSSFDTHDFEEGKLESWQKPLEVKNDKHKLFRGNMMWFCSNGDTKVFSKTETLTICDNKENYLNKVDNYAYFSRFFKLPELIYQDDDNYQLVERYIDFQRKSNQDIPFILNNIYDDCMDYFSTMKRESRLAYYTLNDLFKTSSNTIQVEHFKYVFDNIDNQLFEIEFPFIRLHGDLWTANILLEKEKNEPSRIWYIDWDESGDYFFFYDFFKFMWNELDVNGHSEYYERYLNGEFDNHFKKVFDIFQLEFHPELKKDYFCMFILNFLLDDSGRMPYELKLKEATDFQQKILLNDNYS